MWPRGSVAAVARATSNFRIRNSLTGATCGHHHHTREKALACIPHMGWDPEDCMVEMFRDDKERKTSMHHKPRTGRRGTREAEYRTGPLAPPETF